MEIEDLPTSQYVSLEGRMSDLPHVLTWGGALGWAPGGREGDAWSLP